jgi:coenzyme F420-reducing hydrogenase alpha subunit
MKKTCNDICDILVGRHVHPISCIVGGFTKLPGEKDLDSMLSMLEGMLPDMDATVELIGSLSFPQFERDTEYVGLVNDTNEYPLLEGDVGSTDGLKIHKKEYRSLTNEFVVPHSSAKHTKASRQSYMVGALARVNLNYSKLLPKAKKLAEQLKMKPKVTNPFLNTAAQLIECVHCLEDSIAIVKRCKNKGIRQEEAIVVGINENNVIPVRAGIGFGAVEVPRGILFHNYEIDDKGKIINANCIIPTNQNLNNIEHDMRKLVPEILNKKDEEITLLMEMLVRAYDPCISCSAHFLDVQFTNR